MAIYLLRDGSGKGPVIGRDVLADTKSFAIDETIAHSKDVAGDEDHVLADSGQDALIAAQGPAEGFGLAE